MSEIYFNEKLRSTVIYAHFVQLTYRITFKAKIRHWRGPEILEKK